MAKVLSNLLRAGSGSYTSTGTGNLVLSTSPTLISPTLGAASATSLSLTNALTVASGGTGASSLTANSVLLGNGTGAVQVVAPGTTGQVLTSNGTSAPSWNTVATGLTPTSVKIDDYNAVANDLVRCNSTTKSFNIALPASPLDGAMIGIMDVTGTFGTHAVSVLPGSGKTIEGDSTAFVLDMNNAYIELVYTDGGGLIKNWRVQETPLGLLGSVSTSGAQTLTNKTLDSPVITGTLTVNSSTGTIGQVLTSNGASAPSWTTPAPGVPDYILLSQGII